MRRTLAVAMSVLALGSCAKAQRATKETEAPRRSPPVALQGTVNDHGTRDLTRRGATVSLELEADDFYFEPTYVKVAPGAKVTVEVKNEGKTDHTFTIDQPAVDVVVAAGERKTAEVTLPQSGVVRFYCRFHASQGMQGAFYFS